MITVVRTGGDVAMKTKKAIALWMVVVLLLAGCASSQSYGDGNAAPETTTDVGQTGGMRIISPLPDSTMENLTDAILSISLEEGDAYVDDTGIMRMDLKIYTYDKYDMVDIAGLKVGDTIVRHSGEVTVVSIEQSETGTVYINGGFDNDGFDLVANDSGIFYEKGFNDAKNWYEIGEATIRVSADFRGTDKADLELGEITLYPGDFLVGAVTNYDFTPYNTTIRVEVGQVVEMNRTFIP